MRKIVSMLRNKSVAALLSKVLSAGMTFIFLFLIAKAVDTNSAGVFLYSYGLMMILVQLSRAGTDNAIIKLLASSKRRLEHKVIVSNTLWFVTALSLCLSVIVLTVSYTGFLPLYDSDNARLVLWLFIGVTLAFTIMQVFASYFQSQAMVYSQYWSLGLGVSVAGCMTCIVSYLLKWQLVEMSLGFLIGVFITLFSSLLLYIKGLNRAGEQLSGNAEASIPNFKDMLKTTLPFTGVAFIMILIQQGGAFLSGIWLSNEQLALVSIAFRVSTLVGFLFVAFCALLAPRISKSFEASNIQDIHDHSIKQVFASNLFAISLFLFFIMFGQQLLALFGSEYAQAYIALIIFSFCWVCRSIAGPVGTILTMTKNLKALRINLYISAAAIVFSAVVAIPEYGVLGAAFSSLCGTLIMCVLNVYQVKSRLGISFISMHSFKMQINCAMGLLQSK